MGVPVWTVVVAVTSYIIWNSFDKEHIRESVQKIQEDSQRKQDAIDKLYIRLLEVERDAKDALRQENSELKQKIQISKI